jgi:hypothetical protein
MSNTALRAVSSPLAARAARVIVDGLRELNNRRY